MSGSLAQEKWTGNGCFVMSQDIPMLAVKLPSLMEGFMDDFIRCLRFIDPINCKTTSYYKMLKGTMRYNKVL